MGERAKLGVIVTLLLLVLVFVAFSAANTYQAVRNFQQQYSEAKSGNVNTLRPWMTVHAISLIYHVPKDYLYSSLNIADAAAFHHATLYEIANRQHQPVDKLIHALQHAILKYRKEHPGLLTPTPTPRRIPRAKANCTTLAENAQDVWHTRLYMVHEDLADVWSSNHFSAIPEEAHY